MKKESLSANFIKKALTNRGFSNTAADAGSVRLNITRNTMRSRSQNCPVRARGRKSLQTQTKNDCPQSSAAR
nr:MAG TPA: hypothetical protein [Caudoviricetes sp.]